MKISVRKDILSFTVMMLLIVGVASWVSSNVSSQTGLQRWHPRRTPANADFIGDQECARCHKAEVLSHSNSAMALAMEPIATSKVLTENPLMSFRSGPYAYEIKRKDKESLYTVTDGQETISVPILYAFGQGKAGQTYVLQYDGAYYESLVSFYNEVRGLDFTIGAPRTVPASLKSAFGRRLSDNEAGNCFSCHSTGGVIGGKINLEKMAVGVRCEACHGPGGPHVTAIHTGEPSRKLIFNPNRLSGDELSQDFCAACHRGNDEFGILKTMEINNVRFQPYRLFHSKCYSDDRRISCTACHNPHEPLERDAAHYDTKCLACHLSRQKGSAVHPEQVRGSAASCKVGTKDCVSCHMPKIGPPAAHFKFTDHYIRIVKPREAYPN